MKKCNNCNKYNDDDANFCKYCGSNLKDNIKIQQDCSECGYTMIGNPKFCSECGTKTKK